MSSNADEKTRPITGDPRSQVIERPWHVPEILEIETKLAILFSLNDLAELLDETRSTVRRQTHDLAFIAVVWEAKKLCRRRIENTDRVWVLNLAQDFN